jgi:hypothetical protein
MPILSNAKLDAIVPMKTVSCYKLVKPAKWCGAPKFMSCFGNKTGIIYQLISSTLLRLEDRFILLILSKAHRQIRKYTKTKGAFTSENALFKLVFSAIKAITAKWNMPVQNWALTVSQLDIYFPNRLKFGR